jgi:D-sedoheptulose 7-phosphate isomerase
LSPLASLALGSKSSTISAVGKNYGYEQVLARELQGIAYATDIFIPISAGGNSLNILAAVKVANGLKIKSVAWTGKIGGQLHGLCECIRMKSRETTRIQVCHIMAGNS